MTPNVTNAAMPQEKIVLRVIGLCELYVLRQTPGSEAAKHAAHMLALYRRHYTRLTGRKPTAAAVLQGSISNASVSACHGDLSRRSSARAETEASEQSETQSREPNSQILHPKSYIQNSEACRAKDPAQCPYHGTPEHADEQGSSATHHLSSPDSPADTAPPKDDATPAERAAAIEDIRSLLSGQRQVHFDDSVPTSMIRNITNSLASLKKQYPVDNLQSIGSYKDDNDAVYAEADGFGIRINHDAGTAGIFNTPKKLDPQKNGGFSRSVVAASYKRPLDGIIAHEYGHLIAFHCENADRHLIMHKPGTPAYKASSEGMHIWKNWKNALNANIGREKTEWARTSLRAKESHSEFFAECFAMHVLGQKVPSFAKKYFTTILQYGTRKP